MLKKLIKTQEKFKELEVMYQNLIYICIFWYSKICWFPVKMLISAELRGCVTWFIYFLDLPWVKYNCAKFHHCRICVTDFREGGPFCHTSIREQPRKSPPWIGSTVSFPMISINASPMGLTIGRILYLHKNKTIDACYILII